MKAIRYIETSRSVYPVLQPHVSEELITQIRRHENRKILKGKVLGLR